ncbi:hypothetical protein EYF80_038617 [Liparis tanakae]|uniref:Uncharacterized protein n=1 Tax=Liparis tanakae TaxID=230148 RepID=A0A4Z2GCV5_9TELE|nr:hypothetical protein EYF80_038617 [Liparis tanakae]
MQSSHSCTESERAQLQHLEAGRIVLRFRPELEKSNSGAIYCSAIGTLPSVHPGGVGDVLVSNNVSHRQENLLYRGTGQLDVDVADPVGSSFLLPVTLHVQVVEPVSVQLDHFAHVAIVHLLVGRGLVPGTAAPPVDPVRDFRANSTFFLAKPMSMSCSTRGRGGGRGAGFCLLGLGGRTCCTARGVEASLETLSSHRGEDGEDDSTASSAHINSWRCVLSPGHQGAPHLHLLPVERGLDGRRLRGGGQQLLQEDQGGRRALGGQVPPVGGGGRRLLRRRPRLHEDRGLGEDLPQLVLVGQQGAARLQHVEPELLAAQQVDVHLVGFRREQRYEHLVTSPAPTVAPPPTCQAPADGLLHALLLHPAAGQTDQLSPDQQHGV